MLHEVKACFTDPLRKSPVFPLTSGERVREFWFQSCRLLKFGYYVMAFHCSDNVYTKAFTPREYQVELLASAKERNIIVCLGNGTSKTFISLKLIQELSNEIRRSYLNGGKRTVFITPSAESAFQYVLSIRLLTDLKVGEYVEIGASLDLSSHQVLVMTCDVALAFILSYELKLSDINLLILDDCHFALRDHAMCQIANFFGQHNGSVKLLGMTAPLVPGPGGAEPGRLEAEVQRLESVLSATTETASDIVSVLRYSSKPKEVVLECAEFDVSELRLYLDDLLQTAKDFLEDHRYDPSEIYEEEFKDDILNIPSPKQEPTSIIEDFKTVLHTMGPWCADKAALVFLLQIEKLKVKIPYERHFLLLCMVSSLMLKVRAICDDEFQEFTESEKIYKFSSPKVLRLVEIFRSFKPKSQKSETGIINETEDSTCVSDQAVGLHENIIEKSYSVVDVNANNSINEPEIPNDSTEVIHENVTEKLTLISEYNHKNINDTDTIPILIAQVVHDHISDKENSVEEVNNKSTSETEKAISVVEVNDNNVDDTKRPTKSIKAVHKNNCEELSPVLEVKSIGEIESFSSVSVKVLAGNIKKSSSTEGVNGKNVNEIDTFQSIKAHVAHENISVHDAEVQELCVKLKNIHLFCRADENQPLLDSKYGNNIEVLNSENNCNGDSIETNVDTFIHKQKKSIDENNSKSDQTDSNVPERNVTVLVEFGNCSFAKDTVKEISVDVNTTSNFNNEGLQTTIQNTNVTTEEIIRKQVNQEDSGVPGKGSRFRGKSKGPKFQKKGFTPFRKTGLLEDGENLCAIIFVEDPLTAKMLFHLLNELRRCDPDFSFISPQYTVSKTANPITEPREAEVEHRKQEEVLKRFRMRECNVLISTSFLEEGIDLPKCNLIIRYDVPTHYRSYAQSKSRARTQDSHFILMTEHLNTASFISDLAQFMEIEKMLLNRCTNNEPPEEEEIEADRYNRSVPAFCPGSQPVTMSSAISLVNRYCAKLPSDTFTRLTPLWSVEKIQYLNQDMFYCTVRLPINSPVKEDIIGHPMPSVVLARRVAALETCRVLHRARELDNSLMPVGKESFLCAEDEDTEEEVDMIEPRPGTTKRRQYYYKRIANAFSDCRPIESMSARLYHLKMILTCPLPEEQNTRGRKLHPPEEAPQGFGILTLKPIPQICPFPIFTRSGEVCVSLELCQEDLLLSANQLEKISTFLNYTFTSVLRLQKYLMLFDTNSSENCYMIVPTKKDDGRVVVDWDFLELIHSRREEMPHVISDKEREKFQFNDDNYHDAVVMPWYRNQDQPQYFYVAEICNHLSPKSSFPGSDYDSFEEYYQKKYGITIQNSQQPLLDVDHTSARLNFLTPRYVNRKGVALPTSSEETKRAKRENLEQKQILVPELCMIHPFPASLWRQAVCLPCVLYRINALLLADEIRTTVAREIGVGQLALNSDFSWPSLDFGWSLADVLKKSKEENEKNANKASKKIAEVVNVVNKEEPIAVGGEGNTTDDDMEDSDDNEEEKDGPWMEIGTWSNEMAEVGDNSLDSSFKLPDNLSMVRYGSPTSWDVKGGEGLELCLYDSDVETTLSSCSAGIDTPSERSDKPVRKGLRITFMNDYLAMAEDDTDKIQECLKKEKRIDWQWQGNNSADLKEETEREIQKFRNATEKHKDMILNSGMLIACDIPFTISTESSRNRSISTADPRELDFDLTSFGMPSENLSQLMKRPSSPLLPGDSAEGNDFDQDSEDSSDFGKENNKGFSFDAQPDLENHPGPSPSVLLQALTMSNANDGINLERLETIGDSFLKYAITTYLYCAYEAVHEGKLSHLRSKQVSNLNLYKLGKKKQFGESMIATKFEPHDNWLPPCYLVPRELERALVEAGLPAGTWGEAEVAELRGLSPEELIAAVKERVALEEDLPCFIPYNLITQHSIPDKSIADCVEALIGAYLIACGPRGALIFMSWLGIRVLPSEEFKESSENRTIGVHHKKDQNIVVKYGHLNPPKSPLLRHVPDPEGELSRLLDGFDVFERQLKYHFQDRSYLLQAMTHASYSPNRLTDCYQRLEFLGDAVLDYLITRHLYEDKRQHSPGALTDLRSALVNNTIFASLAVRHGFHKYFRHLSPGLSEVVERFVRIQEENSHAISEEYYLIDEEECEEAEDVEVPKALGDVFESVAGAVFLDSSMSLDAVWKVYYRMMKSEIEQFSTNVPKSPIRELLELEPETAKFGKPEKLADGRRVRVTVEVFGKGAYKGIGRNYRIAKCTAAKCALKQLKKRGLLSKKVSSA